MTTKPEKIKIGTGRALGLLLPYAKKRVMEQVKSVAVIIVYLVFFQIVVLGIPVSQALLIAFGLSLVVLGLAFFMEGLLIGLMPLGEVIGIKLPQKTKLPVILIFAFLMGVGATFAEPAIGVLKAAGSAVRAWDAPLLFLLLNKNSQLLVNAVGAGVGVAVLFGMLRFMYNWSLKPFIYILTVILLSFSIWSYFDQNMLYLTGLAWDCGGVTTGPVTVPLVLALGIGISRIVGGGDSEGGGFGVVTLASLFPIVAVLGLGVPFLGQVSSPLPEKEFFSQANRASALVLFNSEAELRTYAFENASPDSHAAVMGGSEALNQFVTGPAEDRAAVFADNAAFEKWAILKASAEVRALVFPDPDSLRNASTRLAQAQAAGLDYRDVSTRNTIAALQAIIPLSLFLILVLLILLRERLPRADEVILGIAFAVFGMGLFNVGIELGLSQLGSQVGGKLPVAFKSIELPDQKQTIAGFDEKIVQTAVTQTGERFEFFYAKMKDEIVTLPFIRSNLDALSGAYEFIPTRGPLFGSMGGIVVVLLFAFIMGYGATLAEPALNALGLTVEELTVGTFKKSLLMQAVAMGVGLGITFGVAKIIWDIPLVYMLVPPYLVALIATFLSTEEFVNIGWDSAGVTTGPITVPLVLALGLGISSEVGVVEGFGILAMASVWPILSVLVIGILVTRSRRASSVAANEAEVAQ